MGLVDKMADALRESVRSFLQLQPSQKNQITINESVDYATNAGINRIWYRGDADELTQLYQNLPGEAVCTRFWAARSSKGLSFRKIHTGLPGLIVDVLASIVVADMNDIELRSEGQGKNFISTWQKIEKENRFRQLMKTVISETLAIGDGAFKISLDPELSQYPIIEFVTGENLEYVMNRGRVQAIRFKTPYPQENKKNFVLIEEYGHGYIRSELRLDGKLCDLNCIPETEHLEEMVSFDKSFMMAVPFKIYESKKWKYRGKSIFDGKTDSFDSFDETWSQWMDAIRHGRSNKYIPQDMIPRNPDTGMPMQSNPFDNEYIAVESSMKEGQQSKIEVTQPAIPHDSYLATYITALDLCLQGIISPSTLGIDTKKLDNADAQREKEKTTLYTRNQIVDALQEVLPELIDVVYKTWLTQNKQSIQDIDADIPFGEYANPSFESQVETVGKGKAQGIMSIEAAVEELYGDSKDAKWKEEEVARLKVEQGIVVEEDPFVGEAAGQIGFTVPAGDA